jgi:hypothetical protein
LTARTTGKVEEMRYLASANLILAGIIHPMAWSSGGYNLQVGRVVTADLVALVALVIGAAAYAMNTNH